MIDVTLTPGRYVVAVSGGVDSVVLLDVLGRQPEQKLTVAHLDHGIRADSADDARFVSELAARYQLPFITKRVELGAGASEAAAREVRYEFLEDVRSRAGAQAIITAHHQDDRLETAIHNIIRGTNRRGLSSLQSSSAIVRPFLSVPKSQILAYAEARNLSWREDSTNSDVAYTRNYIRHRLLTRVGSDDRQKLLAILAQIDELNRQIDREIDAVISAMVSESSMARRPFSLLPHSVAREVMAGWLRVHNVENVNAKMLERLVHAAKTFPPTSSVNVTARTMLLISKMHLALSPVER